MVFLMDDDIANQAPKNMKYSDSDINDKMYFTWQPNSLDVLKNQGISSLYVAYDNYYERIMGCNVVLTYVDGSDGSEEDRVNLKGEALVLRAWYYFQLVNLYALPYNAAVGTPETNSGVVLMLSPEISGKRYSRSSVGEVYKQITEDLEEGIALLEQEKRDNSYFRLNNLSAHLIASRVYLYMENWDKVLAHANAVKEVKQMEDFSGYTDETYEETKLFREYSDEIIWRFGISSQWLPIYSGYVSTSDGYRFSPELYDLYQKQPNEEDKRLTFFFHQEENYLGRIETTFVKYAGMYDDKYTYEVGLRVTEAYMNAIEALLGKYKNGDTEAGAEGLKQLNEFRAKRIVSASGGVLESVPIQDADKLIEIYRTERRKEFCFEGQRWFDLRRWGMPRLEHRWYVSENAYELWVLEENDPMYVLDIPQDALDRNTSLAPNDGAFLPERQATETISE